MVEDAHLLTLPQVTSKLNSKPSSQLKKLLTQPREVNERQETKESQFKNANLTMDHHSRPEACKIVHSTKGKHADSLEPEAIIKMEEQNKAFEPQWEVQE